MSADQPIRYYADTDTMYVELRPGPTTGGEDAGADLVIHFGEDGEPAGYEIEHASQHPAHTAAALELFPRFGPEADWPGPTLASAATPPPRQSAPTHTAPPHRDG